MTRKQTYHNADQDWQKWNLRSVRPKASSGRQKPQMQVVFASHPSSAQVVRKVYQTANITKAAYR
eukprot:4466289-Amphidinium_carterae.1